LNINNTTELMELMKVFDKLFDIARIVDPVEKEVVNYLQINDRCNSSICYEFWNQEQHCANCVSMRAINEDNTFIKIEYNKDKIFMIMASPTVINEKKYAIELLKDISDTGIVPDLKGKNIDEMNEIIAKLNHEVITDGLTGSYNRRFLNERLPVDIYNTFKNNHELSVILLDCDNLKEINDSYGHLCGDDVLISISNNIKEVIREKNDWVARYGGDEFLISMPGTNSDEAFKIADRIKNRINSSPLINKDNLLNLSVSMGLYTLVEVHLTMEELLYKVDKKLFQAKNGGKNKIVSSCSNS